MNFSRALIALALLLTLPLALAPAPAEAAAISPALDARLLAAAPDELIEVYVLLDEQLDRPIVAAETAGMDRRELRAHVVDRLKQVARAAQAPLLAELDALRPLGAVGEVTSLWVANLIIAELDPATIRRLAADSAVRSLHVVRRYEPGEATDDLPAVDVPMTVPGAIEPNIELINANGVWDLGYEGQGMIVANIDTGTDDTHADLKNHIWRNIDEIVNGIDDDGNGFVDDVIGWDFESNDNDPTPSGSSHGTNTAGIVVGDGSEGRQTGVAPKGNVMILKACGESPAMSAVQYALDNGADAITSSCSYKFPFRPAYAVWREISANELAAGMIHANSIGNQGQSLVTYPIPYNISAPGITPPSWLHPEQPIVGGLGALVATGGVNVNLSQYGPSGVGPAAWEDIQINYPTQKPIPPGMWDYLWANGTMEGLMKPEIVMPTNVWTTRIGTGYQTFGGTSAATPHTGGSLALLQSVAPDATPAELSQALQESTTDLGTPGKDNKHGSGIPDLLVAAQSIMPDVTPVLEPYGQAIDPGGTFSFHIELINNTGVQQVVSGRLDIHSGGQTRTIAGPANITIDANSSKVFDIDFTPPGSITDRLGVAEVVIEDLGGTEIASADVEIYIF